MKLRILFPVIALMTASCVAPQVVTQLVPEAPEGHFEHGREYIPLKNDSIELELGFDGFYEDYLVFDLVVINHTPDTLLIQPSDFYYAAIDSPTADTSRYPCRMAVHPERILKHYNQKLEQGEDHKSVNKVLGFIEAGMGLLANTTAFIATDNPGYMADAIFQTLGTAGNYIATDKMLGEEIKIIREEREIVSQEIFRQTELPPGKVSSGFIYFPAYGEDGFLMFCFPLEDQLFQFVYNKQRFYRYN